MDGVSAVAGVATAGVQLSKYLYDLYSTVKTSRQEIEDVANNVSLLAIVLEELDGVLCDDVLNYRPQLREAAQSIALRCASIFKDIRKHTGTDRALKGKKLYEKVAWYFKKERVKPLRCSLESLKSTLNILLHVVQLAKSTKGVEEYPGVKPIGQWYVRKERRGLVCLVIDNRHGVEKLKQLEEQHRQVDFELIENEQPLAFAEIFPLPSSNHKRGQSPERKFVVAFRSPSSQTPDMDLSEAGPSSQNSHNSLISPAHDNDNDREFSMDSDAEGIGGFPSSRSMRKSRARARATKDRAVSRLILDFIPHEEADKTFKAAQNMNRSALLEAKAEETIDILMRDWTYVDPKYFSEDDCSSVSSIEPTARKEKSRDFQTRESIDAGKTLSGFHEDSGKKKWGLLEKSGPAKALDGSQNLPLEEAPKAPSASSPGLERDIKKRPSPLLPSHEDVHGIQAIRATSIPSTTNDQGVSSPREPSTPAPPYPSSQPGQCTSCYSVSAGKSKSSSGKPPYQPAEAGGQENGARSEEISPIDGVIRLFESKLLQSLKNSSGDDNTFDAQSFQVGQEPENHPRQTVHRQEVEPVILKDCLGRKFLFPIQKCRTWQEMEILIKRSFAHIESMNTDIFRGNYDVLGPTGEIILPEIWDAVIKPGWIVEVRLWDLTEARWMGEKQSDAGIVGMAPAVRPSSSARRQRHIEVQSDSQLVTARRRVSLRTWLGSRKSTPGVVIE